MMINHNITALNAWRSLSQTNSALAKSLEKLSSGMRINRAADDAAGLAISEKMRAQIRGLNQAIRNAQDAISLIQTAEGALNETHSILQRMRELAVQAANDSNTAGDREAIQKEIDQLAQELARIGNTTEYNTQKLLNGTFEGTFHIGANKDQSINLAIGDMRGYALGMAGDVTYQDTATVTDSNTDNKVLGVTNTAGSSAEFEVVYDESTNKYKMINDQGQTVATSSDGKTWTASDGSDDTLAFNDAVTSGTITVFYDGSAFKATGTAHVTNGDGTVGLEAGVYTYDGTVLKNENGEVVATYDSTKGFVDVEGNVLFTPSATLSAGMIFEVKGIDVSNQDSANNAIEAINNAIETVSTERAKLGAYQNRLEHTIANLGVAAENLTAAESRIRDVDMAQEMMNFTRQQILVQAGTVMLAQANMAPQAVLRLLG
ncbi:MAG: Flagellin domain protein [Clostridia bacterium 62_21]|nr:MAG: Flagellin domain protein [Clostridia bacterium 62_21]